MDVKNHISAPDKYMNKTYLNHGDSTVDKGCSPFTRYLVTALWHSSVLCLFSLFLSDCVKEVVTAETAASLRLLSVAIEVELPVLKKIDRKKDDPPA